MLAANLWVYCTWRLCEMTKSPHPEDRSTKTVQRAAAISTVLGLVILGLDSSLASGSRASQYSSDVVDGVSGSEIMESVIALQGFGPSDGVSSRAFYLNSTDEVAAYIHDRLADLGLYVTYQEFEISGHEVRNVIGVLNGTDPAAPCALFGAHYDSENYVVDNLSEAVQTYGSAPGADDDASGVAAVIEIARVLKDSDFRNTIKFVAFTAEEAGYDYSGGLKGSTVFAWSEKLAGVSYLGTVIMDMIGYRLGDQNILTIIKQGSTDLYSDSIVNAADQYGIDLSISTLVDPSSDYSDHYPFWSYGYPSILLIEEFTDTGDLVNPNYHTANDTYDKLSEEQMVATVKATVGGTLSLLTIEEEHGINIYAVVLVIILVVAVVAYIAVRSRKVE